MKINLLEGDTRLYINKQGDLKGWRFDAGAEIVAMFFMEKPSYEQVFIYTMFDLLRKVPRQDRKEWLEATIKAYHQFPQEWKYAYGLDVEAIVDPLILCQLAFRYWAGEHDILKNPHMRPCILKLRSLFLDKTQEQAIGGLAENTSSPMDVLIKVSRFPCSHRYLARNPNISNDIALRIVAEKNEYADVNLSHNKNVSGEVLDILAHLGHQVGVAQHPNTLNNTLEYLSRDKEMWVRYSVAAHKNTSVEVLEELINDEDYMVWFSVIRNPNTPQRVIEEFLIGKDEPTKQLVKNLLGQREVNISL